VSGFAVDEDVSGALLDDAVTVAKPKPVPLPVPCVKKGSKMRDTVACPMRCGIADAAERVSAGMFWCWSSESLVDRFRRVQEELAARGMLAGVHRRSGQVGRGRPRRRQRVIWTQ